MLSLSLEKLVTCGVIRSYNFVIVHFAFRHASMYAIDWAKTRGIAATTACCFVTVVGCLITNLVFLSQPFQVRIVGTMADTKWWIW